VAGPTVHKCSTPLVVSKSPTSALHLHEAELKPGHREAEVGLLGHHYATLRAPSAYVEHHRDSEVWSTISVTPH
jgi:hypothetical protein